MKAVLLRTGSVPAQLQSFLPGSPRVSLSVHDSVAGIFSGDKNGLASPRISLHLDVSRRRDSTAARGIRRALSESDVRLSGVGSLSFPARIPEEECLSGGDDGVGGIGFPGGGIGKGRKSGGGGDESRTGTSTGGNADRSKIGVYYREMLKSDPTNSLLLRNYGRFLHEVERDMVKAEEYYGRAILASSGDGEVLSLYGKLIWESQRDEDRAKSYFDQALHASPDDCMVLGSYAHFMWEAEEEEGDYGIERENDQSATMGAAAAMVEAF